MKQSTPDRVIAHVDLLRAVDKLLSQADQVREKREVLNRSVPERTDNVTPTDKRAGQ